jgi:predicted transcriptional regulator
MWAEVLSRTMSGKTRRSGTEITLEMLSTIRYGEKRPTRIMYECNLSYHMCKSKLEEFVANDLVKEQEELLSKDGGKGHAIYEITEKGIEMIENLSTLINMLNL